MNIQELITSIIKIKDSEAGLEVYSSLVAVLESTYNDTEELISDIYGVLQDPDYLTYIEGLLGRNSLSTAKTWLLDNIAYLQKVKGTRFSWEKYFSYLYDNVEIIELNKDSVYEDTSWSEFGLLKSSKVSFACETIAETSIDIETQEEYFEQIESIAPVHVSLARDATNLSFTDSVDYIEDSIGCLACETLEETSDYSQVYGYLTSEIDSITDSVDVTVRCIATCETTCEDCCETACECSPCELYCESGCEESQTHGTGYAGGSCILVCETDCQENCELFCEWQSQAPGGGNPYCVSVVHLEAGCGIACELGKCEGGNCVISCQSYCQQPPQCQWGLEHQQQCFDCQAFCEYNGACEVGCQSCQSGCQGPGFCQVIGGCQGNCQINCQVEVQTTCLHTCEMPAGCQLKCEGVCEVLCEPVGSCQHGCQLIAEDPNDRPAVRCQNQCEALASCQVFCMQNPACEASCQVAACQAQTCQSGDEVAP